jgi:hypothetical protein
LSWSYGNGDQHGSGRAASQERAKQLDRPGVRPMKIVEDEHHWFRCGERLEKLSNRAVSSVALILECNAMLLRADGDGREDDRELCTYVFVQELDLMGLECLDVLVDRVDKHPEGQIALEL